MKRKNAEKVIRSSLPTYLNKRLNFMGLARAFWQGFSQPHGATALSAVVMTIGLGIFLLCKSTEANVRVTDPARWLRSPDDDYGHLTAYAIQGAERHAKGLGTTIVFVGPSALQNLLPAPAEIDHLLTLSFGRAARGIDLTARALSTMEEAAVVSRFGRDFDGWLVVGVNRHTLGRNLKYELDRKKKQGFSLPFDSPILNEELSRANLPPALCWNIAVFDHSSFYFGSLAGWKYLLQSPPIYTRPVLESKRPFGPAKIRAALSSHDPSAFETNLGVLSRMAERYRTGGGAKLAIVECPFADEVVPAVQTSAWRLERDEFTRQREAWASAYGVPWIDVTSELGLQPADFLDPLHVDNPQVRRRFVEAVVRRLATFTP